MHTTHMDILLGHISALCMHHETTFSEVCDYLSIDQRKFICDDDIKEVEDEVKKIAEYFGIEENTLYLGIRR